MGFSTYKSVSFCPKISVFREHFEHLQTAKSMIEIMNIVRTYCNFFSYEIIEELVKALGDDKDKGSLHSILKNLMNMLNIKYMNVPLH